MIMIGHQAIGVNFKASLLTGLGKRLVKTLPIDVVQEDILAPVSAAQDMVNGPGILDSHFARNLATMAITRIGINLKNDPKYGLTPFR